MKSSGTRGVTGERQRLSVAVPSLIGIACLLVSGCASQGLAKSEAQRDFGDMIEEMIQEAEAGGAGDAQVAILRHAQEEGVVSIEDARTAARAMVQCVKDAGSDAFVQDQTMQSGVVLPAYNFVSNTPAQAAIGDACDTKEAFWVNGAYQMQPTSIALNDAHLDQQAPVVRSCLKREGYEVDGEIGTHDLMRQAAKVKLDTDSKVDCLSEAAIEGF